MTEFVPGPRLLRYLFLLVGAVLISSIALQAKLTISPSVLLHHAGIAIYETDFAFDAQTNVGLAVFRQSGTLKVRGVYVGPTGAAASGVFDLTTNAPRELRGPRVAARSGGGGGFLVTFFLEGAKGIAPVTRAIFVHPGSSTILGPVTIDSNVSWYSNPGGVEYVPEHDAFLVAYRKGDDTYMKWVKVVDGDLEVSSAAVQVTSGACNYTAPEISWDFERDIALVAGFIDGCDGGVWMRRVSFNGSTISPIGTQATINGVRYYDVRVAFSDLIDRWLVIYTRQGTNPPRHVHGNLVAPDGTIGSQRTILPANTGNSTSADDKFGGNNGLGLAYNPFSGRFVLGARGNDTGGGLAPLFAVELDTNGVAIPKTFAEVLGFDVTFPWPRPVAVPNSQNFLMLSTGGPGAPLGQLRVTRIVADGQEGTGTWPPADGGGGGGGGGEDPPPPPPPSGSFTLTITKPSGGIIIGNGIYCGLSGGTNGNACQTTKPAGTVIALAAYPASGNVLVSWGGCGPSVTFSSNISCAPTFGPSGSGGGGDGGDGGGGGGGGGGGTGNVTLTIERPTGGLILGPDIYCGTTSSAGTRCQIARPVGTTISLIALPAAGETLTSWGGCAPSFTLTADRSCAPTFSGGEPPAPTPPPPSTDISLTVINPANGSEERGGHIFMSGGVGWIAPGESASRTYSSPTAVTLLPIPQTGYMFAGWIGTGCANSMIVNNERTCIAVFSLAP